MLFIQFILFWALFWASETGKVIAGIGIAAVKLLATTLLCLGLFAVGCPLAVQCGFSLSATVTAAVFVYLAVLHFVLRKGRYATAILNGLTAATAIIGGILLFRDSFPVPEMEKAIITAEALGVSAFTAAKTAYKAVFSKNQAPSSSSPTQEDPNPTNPSNRQ